MENTDNISKLVLLIVCVGELRGEVKWNKSALKKEILTERSISWCVWDHQFSCNFIHVVLGTPSSPAPLPEEEQHSSFGSLVKANWKVGKRLTREMWWEIVDIINISSLGVQQSLWVAVQSGFAKLLPPWSSVQCEVFLAGSSDCPTGVHQPSAAGATCVACGVSVWLTQLIPALLSWVVKFPHPNLKLHLSSVQARTQGMYFVHRFIHSVVSHNQCLLRFEVVI